MHIYGTPEGHAIRYGTDGAIVGITIVKAQHLLDGGELVITVPHVVDVRRDELELALN